MTSETMSANSQHKVRITLLDAMRLDTTSMIMLLVLALALVAMPEPLSQALLLQSLCMALTAGINVAGQFVWNDMCDAEIDAARGHRVMLGIDLRRPTYVLLLLAAMVYALSVGVPVEFVLIWAGINVILTCYSWIFTKHHAFLANVICGIISTIGVLSPLLVYDQWVLAILLGAPFALTLTAREICMDVTDQHVDALYRQRTLPQLIGPRRSVFVAVLLLLSVPCVSGLMFIVLPLMAREVGAILMAGHVIMLAICLCFGIWQRHDIPQALTRGLKMSWVSYAFVFLWVAYLLTGK